MWLDTCWRFCGLTYKFAAESPNFVIVFSGVRGNISQEFGQFQSCSKLWFKFITATHTFVLREVILLVIRIGPLRLEVLPTTLTQSRSAGLDRTLG